MFTVFSRNHFSISVILIIIKADDAIIEIDFIFIEYCLFLKK